MFRCLVGAAHRVVMVTFTFTCGSLSLLKHLPHTHLLTIALKTTKTNKEKEPYLSNVFQFGVSRCLFLCEQNTVPRRPLFVLIPPYKNQVKQVFVSAEEWVTFSVAYETGLY